MALSVEVAELMEILQWKTEAESRNVMQTESVRVRDEIGDITLYLLMLCDRLGVDPLAAASKKMAVNMTKYPVAQSRGEFVKYSRRVRKSPADKAVKDRPQ